MPITVELDALELQILLLAMEAFERETDVPISGDVARQISALRHKLQVAVAERALDAHRL